MKCGQCRCDLEQDEIKAIYIDGNNKQPVCETCDEDIQWLRFPLWELIKKA